jgi:Rieske Fe-S protein
MSQLPVLPSSHPETAACLTRRDFVSTTAMSVLAAAFAASCGGGGGGDPTGPRPTPPQIPANSGASVAGNVLTVQLAQFTSLAQSGGFQVFGSVGGTAVDVIIINLGNDSYRAFTSICTHEQCPVGSFNGSRIVCPCHGSEYDTAGRNVVGPATRPLTEYRVAFDAGARTVTVTKG